MKFNSSRPVFSALALSLFSSFAFSQSITNGTFLGPDQNSVGYDNVTGWATSGSLSTLPLQAQDWDNDLSAPPGGTRASEVLVAWSVSASHPTLSQTVSGLTVGDQCTISFDDAVANRNSDNYAGSFSWGVEFGSTERDSTAITIPAGHSATAWMHNTLTFTATSASEVLEFLAQSSVGVAPEPALFLDNVSISGPAVAAVPEPGTDALMLAGLGTLGWIVRRRKSV